MTLWEMNLPSIASDEGHLPYCDACFGFKAQAVANMKKYFRDLDWSIVAQAGLGFAKEDIKMMRRRNIQIKRAEVGWLGRRREVAVWDR